MSNGEQHALFTEAEVGRQSRINATAMALGLLAHAKRHGELPETAVRWLGETFAPGWEGLQGKGALAALRLAALNMTSVGMHVHTLTGDEHRAEASLGDWPPNGDLAFFGLDREDAEAMYSIFEPIATSLGLRYRWERSDDALMMIVESGTS